MASTFIISLPWPSSVLSSNSNKHWRVKSKAIKACREFAFYACKEMGVPKGDSAVLQFTYHQPDNRRRDCQNMPHMLKAYIDGIADHIGCDDRHFEVHYPPQFSHNKKGGEISVKVTV